MTEVHEKASDTEPSHRRRLAGIEGIPGQGPFMAIVLDIEDDCVTDAHFQTYGCPASQACGQFACEWTIGKTVEQVGELSEADLLRGVGAMPLGREHCPGLTVRALLRAVKES